MVILFACSNAALAAFCSGLTCVPAPASALIIIPGIPAAPARLITEGFAKALTNEPIWVALNFPAPCNEVLKSVILPLALSHSPDIIFVFSFVSESRLEKPSSPNIPGFSAATISIIGSLYSVCVGPSIPVTAGVVGWTSSPSAQSSPKAVL